MLRRLKAVCVLGVVLALAASCGGSRPLGATALSQQLKMLQSEAAEGALLAQDAASGKTTRIYVRERASELYRVASQAELELKAATTEPALEPKLRRVVVLAGRVSAGLKRLGTASPDEDRALARELLASGRLGGGLE